MTLRQFFYRRIYLHTPYWRWIRSLVGRRAHWKCEVRGCGFHGHNLNAHHIKYHLWLEWLNLNNLVYLCPWHHAEVHKGWMQYLTKGRILRP